MFFFSIFRKKGSDLVAGGELWDACMEATFARGAGGAEEEPLRHPLKGALDRAGPRLSSSVSCPPSPA